jgi:hypothetical protein
VFIEFDRTIRDFKEGRETTIIAILISAVHYASAVYLALIRKDYLSQSRRMIGNREI